MFHLDDLDLTSVKSTVSADANEHFHCLVLPSLINRNFCSLLMQSKGKAANGGSDITGGSLSVGLVLAQLKHQWVSEPGDGLCLCQLGI